MVYPKLRARPGCRYLVARKCCVCKATKALEKTLLWRQQFRPDLITWEQVCMRGTKGTRTCRMSAVRRAAICRSQFAVTPCLSMLRTVKEKSQVWQMPCLDGTL